MLYNEYLWELLIRDHDGTLLREAEQDRTARIALAPQATVAPTRPAHPRRGNTCTSNSGTGARAGIRDSRASRKVGRGQTVAGRQ